MYSNAFFKYTNIRNSAENTIYPTEYFKHPNQYFKYSHQNFLNLHQFILYPSGLRCFAWIHWSMLTP